MRYIFPRQFGLHNVFTSPFDKTEGVRDYTSRESEIAKSQASKGAHEADGSNAPPSKLPKRLRGRAFALVKVLQERHARCPYAELFRYYCPRYVG
jgi:telomerase reverse transcriptase